MSDAKKLTNQYRLEQWATIIQECVSSGKLVNDWCAENNISRDKYYYWLRKVKFAAGEVMSKKAQVLEPPKIVPLIPVATACVAINNDIDAAHAAMVIKLNGLVLEIQNNASEAIIERTLKVLKQLC